MNESCATSQEIHTSKKDAPPNALPTRLLVVGSGVFTCQISAPLATDSHSDLRIATARAHGRGLQYISTFEVSEVRNQDHAEPYIVGGERPALAAA